MSITIYPNDGEKKVKEKFMSSIQHYDDYVKYSLVKDCFETIGKHDNDLYFILELEFQSVFNEEFKKYGLVFYSIYNIKEGEEVTEEKSYDEFKKLLDNYIDPNKEGSAEKKEVLAQYFEILKKEKKIIFC